MLFSHRPVAAKGCDDDSGVPRQDVVVVPAVGAETQDTSGDHQETKTKQEGQDVPVVPNIVVHESSGIFESSVFVRLGQSLEFSSQQQQQPASDQEETHHEHVSIVSSGEDHGAKEKDNDNSTYNDKVVDSFVWTSDDDAVDHLMIRNKSARLLADDDESDFHRFKAAVGVFVQSAISSRQKNSSSLGNVKWLGGTGCSLLIVIFGIFVFMMMNHVLAPTNSSSTMQQPSPKQDLQSFVALERDRNNGYMDQLEDLRTEGFQRYARSACVAAGTLEQAQKALFIQLSGIPEDVRTHTIERALIEGITHRSSMQDSSSQLGSHGRAHSYMAFWSTVYHHPRRGGRHHDDDFNTYETCVLVAGMEIGVTEVIAGYKTEEKKVVVGSTPCECGYFYCAGTCPLFSKVIERTPIFQRHSLSLKQQDDLHRWLVKNAIDAAEGLVSGSNVQTLPSTNDTSDSGGGRVDKSNKNALSAQVEVLAWKKPPLVEAFYSDQA
jgi:hypothetical protein